MSIPLWQVVAVIVVFSSIITFVLYRTDKRAAVARQSRVSERTLLVWGLLGGWPGGLIAQRVFHHKTRKTTFQLRFWATVFFDIAAVLIFVPLPFFPGSSA
ncbi:DUF1294 domain-containing protein [Frigoribacterium sp. 2-23]|uniref:DUF1294 domain-containing protein n=1 Tax=Frigoribacterium sp. 2-23 TaxID=3415006 RepID=UPI003C6F3941